MAQHYCTRDRGRLTFLEMRAFYSFCTHDPTSCCTHDRGCFVTMSCAFWRRRFQSTDPCAACFLALHLTSFVIRDHFEQYCASLELCGRNPLKKLSEAPHRHEYMLLPVGWFEVVCSKLNLRWFLVDGSTAAVLLQASRVWWLRGTVLWLGTCHHIATCYLFVNTTGVPLFFVC